VNRILIVPVLLWLLVVAWQDARQQTVANGLTLPPLFLAAFLWLARGAWAVGLLLALLLIAGEVLERLRLPTAMGIGPLILAAGGLAHAAPPDVQLILVAWFCAWAAWALHLAGGADAKVLMALVAFFPDPLLAALLVAAQVAWSVYHLIRRYRGRALQVALTGTLSRPTQEELDAHGVPLLPAYAAAGAAFFLARGL
jgi:Flp pilus assembly protein protease CpaA